MAICQFCRKKIEEEKLMLHEMYCERNCIKCNRCGHMYDQNDPESHEEEFHKLQQCPHCKQEFQDLNKHQCLETPILCTYCQLEIPIKLFSQHEIQCGSRTEMCDSCKQYIKKSEFYKHQEICQQKKFDKLGKGEILDDFPSLQEVKKTYISPHLDQQNKQIQDQQKQNNMKFQTQQPIKQNNVSIKQQKIEYPNEQQPFIQDQKRDSNKDIYNNNSKKEINYSNQKVQDKKQNKEVNIDPKYNNQGLRSTQQPQELKYKSDRIQINEVEQQQFGNKQYNNNSNKQQIEDKYDRNQKQLQDYKQNPRSPQKINNTQEFIQKNDQKTNQYNKQPSNPLQVPQIQQNQINYTQNQYKQERDIKPSYDIYSTDIQQKYSQGQKYNTNTTYQNKQYEYGQPQNYNNKNTNYQNEDNNKQLNRQTKQQRSDLDDRDERLKNNYRPSSKPLDNYDKKYDKIQYTPEIPQSNNQFQYIRNQQAHQDVKYQNTSSQQKQQEYQPKSNEYQQRKPIFESQPKSQNQYQQEQELNTKYDHQTKQYEYGKLNEDNNKIKNTPNNFENNDSVIARQLQEQIYADELHMTPQQIMEQKQYYKMIEENAKKQQSNKTNYEETRESNQLSQSVISNGFGFLTEEERQLQKQLLESIEQKKKQKW